LVKFALDWIKTTCPKCGGKLVERKGKYGDFLGCYNYPKCRYTEKLDEK
jgi:ssDNA-binding Zn-finger/Zn-ribbon topoisomerase 1